MSRSVIRLLILLVVLNLAALPALAQRTRETGSQANVTQINGQVRYAVNGTPAHNVIVSLEAFSGGLVGQVMTDRSGRFRFTGLAPVQYNVTVRAAGFMEERQTLDLTSNPSGYAQFTLKSDGSGAATTAPPSTIDPKVPAPAREAYEKGLKEIEAGKGDKAVPHLEKAVSLYPEFRQAHFMLGTAYMDAKQWDKAEAALRRAIELDPKRSESYFALGELYRQQKKYPEAEKVLREGFQIEDKSWQGHETMARVYVDTNAFDKAAPEIEKTLQLNPNYPEGHLLAANIYLKTRNAEGALKEFEEYLRLAPKGKFAPQAQNAVTKLKEMLKK